jgi:hypothetical protein
MNLLKYLRNHCGQFVCWLTLFINFKWVKKRRLKINCLMINRMLLKLKIYKRMKMLIKRGINLLDFLDLQIIKIF